MKTIILGGHGFLGSALCAEAQKRGWDTIPAGRKEYPQLVGTTCDVLINADGNSKKYLADKDAGLDFDLSVRSVAFSLRDIRAKTYVYLSSVDVYADKSNPACNHEKSAAMPEKISCYGFHKLLAEQIVRRQAGSWLIMRLGGFVGPGLKKNSIYDMLMKQTIRVHPDSRYQYLDVAAMAAIVFSLIESGHHKSIFNLAGEGTVSLKEIAALLPGTPLAGAPCGNPPEHYEVNISKIKTIAAIPATRRTVEEFIKSVLSGAIKLNPQTAAR
ncbi:MAG: NAD-dependent epimerase/dehydratase family protein [Kiritimatiellae bacterium]|jgi:nucleoside-diphosphate-sugar epimerase|nr:NAD-dependent epimerase/dehydratase family protein [Kiritimatiellia bacterium]